MATDETMTETNDTLCCRRFAECVREGEIVRAEDGDETEWFIPEWHHLYFCPFCGSKVQGKGFGTREKPNGKK